MPQVLFQIVISSPPRGAKREGLELKGLWYSFIESFSTVLACFDGQASRALRRPYLEEAGLDSHHRSRIGCGPAHLPGTLAGGDPMGTTRDHAPHRTPARGFARALSPSPELSESPRHLFPASQDHVSRSLARTLRTGAPGANLVGLFYLDPIALRADAHGDLRMNRRSYDSDRVEWIIGTLPVEVARRGRGL